MDRREFLKLGALAGSGALVGGVAQAAEGAAESVRFCTFADMHYFPNVFPNSTREFLDRVLTRAEKTQCDLVWHMGDFVHEVGKAQDYVDHYNDFRIPTYHTLGNHDCDQCRLKERLASFRMTAPYYFFDRKGFRFIALDTNNVVGDDGKMIHYELSNYQKIAAKDMRRISRLGPEQLEWLKATVDASPYPCILGSHCSLERYSSDWCYGSADGEAVRAIVDAANAKRPRSVVLVINGHHHCDFVRMLNGVCYLDLNSASFQFLWKPHDLYPADEVKALRRLPYVVCWNDPLSAVITVHRDGRIECEGAKSTYYRGITHEKVCSVTKNSLVDRNGRLTSPVIQSFAVKAGPNDI